MKLNAALWTHAETGQDLPLSDPFACFKMQPLTRKPDRVEMMLKRRHVNTLDLLCLLVALSWLLSGCAGMDQYVSGPPLQLTAAEEARVGKAVEEKLLQLLGGPYHDKALAKDVSEFIESNPPCKITIADRSAPALYPLPGYRAILTRGLLAEMDSPAALHSLLTRAARLSSAVYDGRVTRAVARTTKEVMASSEPVVEIDSAAIRLARLFEDKPCSSDCLKAAATANTADDKAVPVVLPDSIKRLSTTQAGYALAGSARLAEKDDDHGKAVALYLQAAVASPDEPRILGSLGLAYLRSGDLQAARLYLRKAVKFQPDYYKTQMGLGYVYLQQGQFQQAERALSVSVELLPLPENLFLLAEAREKNGNIKGAASIYRNIMSHDRNSKLGRSAASRVEQLTGVK